MRRPYHRYSYVSTSKCCSFLAGLPSGRWIEARNRSIPEDSRTSYYVTLYVAVLKSKLLTVPLPRKRVRDMGSGRWNHDGDGREAARAAEVARKI
ncbi:MAG: hypothetical protein ACR2JC_11595 [Chloroflexota bacterium]|nr:MAG: hypothetical protein DLM70_02190 [Chloroflexota bacterium]